MMRILLAISLMLISSLALAASTGTSSIFNIPGNDQSMLFLSEIFGQVGNVVGGSTTSPLRIVILLFNNVALVVGGFIILYAIVVSTINTAHDGEMLGKEWSSVWIPMRAAIGFGLLLPTGAGGYALIQVIVMWLVVQGVGAANYIWGQYLKNVNFGNVRVEEPYVSQEFMGSVTTIFQNASCAYTMANEYNQQNEGVPGAQPYTVDIKKNNSESSPSVSFGITNGKSSYYQCGSIALNPYAYSDAADKINNWQQSNNSSGLQLFSPAWKNNPYTGIRNYLGNQNIVQLIQTLTSLADYYVNDSDYCANNTAKNCINNVQKQIITQAQNYVGIASSTYKKDHFGHYATGLKNNQGDQSPLDYTKSQINQLYQDQGNAYDRAGVSSVLYQAQQFGWAYAGAYYIFLANLSSNQGSSPVLEPIMTFKPTISSGSNSQEAINIQQISRVCSNSVSLAQFREGSTNVSDGSVTYVPCLPNNLNTNSQVTATQQVISNYSFSNVSSSPIPLPKLNAAATINAWFADVLSLLLNGMTTWHGNPLVSLSIIGQIIIKITTSVTLVIGALLVGGAMVAGVIPIEGAGLIGIFNIFFKIYSIGLIFVALIIFFCAVFAYYLPLVPYILFTAGVLSWLFLVIEAMVAAPILALGIIHPEGKHSVFGKSEQGVNLLLSIFLRPLLMVIGFIAGSLMIYVAFQLINGGFYTAIIFLTQNVGFSLIGLVFFLAIYASMSVFLVQQCFKLVNKLPNEILRWIGGTAETVGSDAEGEASRSAEKVGGKAESALGNVSKYGSKAAEVNRKKQAQNEAAESKKRRSDHSGSNNTEI